MNTDAPDNADDPDLHLGFVGIPGTGLTSVLTLRELGHPVMICCDDEAMSDVAAPAEIAHDADVVFIEASDADGVDAILFAVTGLASGAPTPRLDQETGDSDPGMVVVIFNPLPDAAVEAATERLAGYGIALAHAPLDPASQKLSDLTADEDLVPVIAALLEETGLLEDA